MLGRRSCYTPQEQWKAEVVARLHSTQTGTNAKIRDACTRSVHIERSMLKKTFTPTYDYTHGSGLAVMRPPLLYMP